MALTEGGDGDCGAHGGGGLVHPLEATGVGAQGLDGSAGAAYEDLSADDGGLRVGGDIAFEGKGPFEFQALDLIDAESGYGGGLEAGVGDGGAPAIPG